MERVRYFVVLHDKQWKISFADKHYGPYRTQRDAIRVAVDAAHKAEGDAQVLVQGQNNQFRTEWTYGNDPYPPPDARDRNPQVQAPSARKGRFSGAALLLCGLGGGLPSRSRSRFGFVRLWRHA